MKRMKQFLLERKKAGTLRSLSPLVRLGHGRVRLLDSEGELQDFSSNDYLALSEHPEVIAASRKYLEMFGAGAGAARLMSGDLEINHLLEEEIAQPVAAGGADRRATFQVRETQWDMSAQGRAEV